MISRIYSSTLLCENLSLWMFVMSSYLFLSDVINFSNNFQCRSSQLDVAGNKKAVVIQVPFRLRKSYRKIHVRLVRELEKKFSGKVDPRFFRIHVFIFAFFCILFKLGFVCYFYYH